MKIDKEKMVFVPKIWGSELHITNNEEYCGKLMVFLKGHSSSFHYHKLKKETFFVHKGKIQVKWSDMGSKTEKEVLKLYNKNDLNVEILYPRTSFRNSKRPHSRNVCS